MDPSKLNIILEMALMDFVRTWADKRLKYHVGHFKTKISYWKN
jgi:hypothetical protein